MRFGRMNARHAAAALALAVCACSTDTGPKPAELTRLEHAQPLRVLWSVILPLSRNSLITAGLFAFLFAWADFLFGVTLTTSDSHAPVTVGIYRFIGANLDDWNGVMATGVIAAIFAPHSAATRRFTRLN